MIPFALPIALSLPTQAVPEAPRNPRQMEIKGVLSSIPVPKKMGEWKGSRAASDPFLPGKAQYRIPLKPNQSILVEIKSSRPTFSVRIVEASGTDTRYDNLPEQTALRKDRALYLNKQKRSIEVLVQIRTTEIVSGETFTLVVTEIDTDSYLKDLESLQKSEPSSGSAGVNTHR